MNGLLKSNRYFESSYSWHIVYEWEDVISKQLNIPLYIGDRLIKFVTNNFKPSEIRKKFLKTYFYLQRFNSPTLIFHLHPIRNKYQIQKNEVVILIDYWKHTDLSFFNEAYSRCKKLYVTSREVYDFLKDKTSLPLNYIPLTFPDTFYLGSFEKEENQKLIANKDIDILQVGRSNPLFETWLNTYLKKHPDLHHVKQTFIDEKSFVISNKFGVLALIDSRESYFEVIKRAKVSLYSSPGMDGTARTGGFNPLTPRFYEFLSQFNYVIGRYSKNEEFEGVSSFCPNETSYLGFESRLNNYLLQSFNKNYAEAADHFLRSRLTSIVFKNFNLHT